MKLELPGPNAQLNTVFAPPPLSSPSTPVNVPGGSAESPSSDKTALFSLADHIAYFYFYVQRQLEGVNGFFEGERTILLNRLEEIGARLPAVRQAAEDGLCHKQLDALVGASRAVLDDLHDLHQFAVANVRPCILGLDLGNPLWCSSHRLRCDAFRRNQGWVRAAFGLGHWIGVVARVMSGLRTLMSCWTECCVGHASPEKPWLGTGLACNEDFATPF